MIIPLEVRPQAQLEHRMLARLGDAVLEGRFGSEVEEPSEHRCEESRAQVWGQRVAKDRAAGLRRDFDRVDCLLVATLRDDRHAGCAQIARPVDLPNGDWT